MNKKEFNPVMSDQEEQMGEVIVTANNKGSRNHYD
jgi:hypothetical protein